MSMIRGTIGRQTPERWSCVKQAWSNRDHDRRGDNKAAMIATLVPARTGSCLGYSTSPFAIWTDGQRASNPNVKQKVKKVP